MSLASLSESWQFIPVTVKKNLYSTESSEPFCFPFNLAKCSCSYIPQQSLWVCLYAVSNTHTHTCIYSVPHLSPCCYFMSLKGICSQTLTHFDLSRHGGNISAIPFHGSSFPAGTDSPPSFWPPAAGLSSVFQGKQPCPQHLANCAPVWAWGGNSSPSASQRHQAGGTGLS